MGITLYQVLDSDGVATHQWLSTDHGSDYYEASFGDPARTELVPVTGADGLPEIDPDGIPVCMEVQHPATYTVVSTDLSGTSRDPRMQALRSHRDALLSSTKWVQERHLDEIALGIPTTVTSATYHLWLQYWQALRALPDTSSDLDAVAWPVPPPTKG